MKTKKILKWSMAILAMLLMLHSYNNLTMKTIPLPIEDRVTIELANGLRPTEVIPLEGKTPLEHVLIYTSLTEDEAKDQLRKLPWEKIVENERGKNVKVP